MKKILMIFSVLVSFTSFSVDVDDYFGGGEDQFDFEERYSDADILMQVDRDAAVACYGALCTLHSVTNKYGGFEIEFNVGVGEENSSGSGTVIVTGNDGYDTGCSDCDEPYWGITLRYKKGKCTQRVDVPRSVYMSVNTYMYGLVKEGGGTRRGFTPADEAMIMFYTTIMSKASGCTMQ